MFKQILVAIDGSPTSTHAYRTALGLARESGMPLHVLHVIDDAAVAQTFDGTAFISPAYVDGLLSGLREAGRRVIAAAQKSADKEGCAIQPLLVETRGRSVASVILAQIRKLRPDLLVLGTHGRRGISRLVMGSDAETVVRESPIPVLLVRSRTTAGVGSRRARPAKQPRAAVAAPRKPAARPLH